MRRLVAVGACYLDTILSVPHYPGEDAKLRATSLVRRRGGNGPNTLEVLLQLVQNQDQDLPLSLCSVLPAQDSLSVGAIESSLGPNVDLSHCIYRSDYSEAASSYIIRSQESGSRTIVNYNELPEMTLGEFIGVADKLKTDDCWFHFEGRIPDTTLACVRHLRKTHPKASVSVELEKPSREGLPELAAEADVVFYSKTWAQAQGYNSAQECLSAESDLHQTPSLLYCTWGSEGASCLGRHHGSLISESVRACLPPGSRPVDSTGAGDTFIAGILFGLLLRLDTSHKNALEFAVRLAGFKVAQEGFDGLGVLMRDHMPQAQASV